MPKGRGKAAPGSRDPATEQFEAGEALVHAHPIFAPLFFHASVVRREGNLCPADGWALVTRDGIIHVHPTRRGEPGEWAYVLAHCLLHLGFAHFQEGKQAREWNAACDLFVARFLADLKFGRAPEDLADLAARGSRDEEALYRELCDRGLPAPFAAYGAAGPRTADLVWGPERMDWPQGRFDWAACFAQGLAAAVTDAVNVAAGEAPGGPTRRTPARQARAWFIDHYPLLGALAATFEIVEDPQICYRRGIAIAAVDPQAREIYINPAAGLDQQEYRFVMAHELLHVGLRHETRAQGRDPYLWNVAADYVINAWLVEMGVGRLPSVGVLYDPALGGESAESIYDRMATDLRRYGRLATLRGAGAGDVLGPSTPDWWSSGAGCDLDDFYRRALSQGLLWHQEQGRGYLPAGLVEEIRALSLPPIPWDVALARWFATYFPLVAERRSYARPSRRQAATPDIPRPSYVPEDARDEDRTFGVILDTSGSMDPRLLGQALGAIASYSLAHAVPAARVVFCDAAPYDQGYMPPEDIAGRVQVRGRGGTVLQPGIDLLEGAEDFPKDGPLLIITDGKCDRLHLRRDHAFLVPFGARLPFVPRGPVFRIDS